MKWLREAVTDSENGCVSSKRVSLLVAAFTLALATAILAIAAMLGRSVDAALMIAVTAPLAGLSGAGYVGGKHVEAKRDADAT